MPEPQTAINSTLPPGMSLARPAALLPPGMSLARPAAAPTAAVPTPEETGVWAGVKRNTVGAAKAVYHAFADDQTPEETTHFTNLRKKLGAPAATEPESVASLAWYRMFEKPGDELSEKADKELKGPGINSKLSGATDKVLSYVPALGPWINSVAERAEKGDVKGAATDLAFAWAAEHAPGLTKAGVTKVAKQWELAKGAKLLDQTAKDFTAAIPPTKSNPYSPADYRASRLYTEPEHLATPVSPDSGIQDTIDLHNTAIGKIEDHVAELIARTPEDKLPSNVLSDVRSALAKHAASDSTYVQRGLDEVERFGFDKPVTISEADVIRRRLNAENQSILQKNNYKQATAREVDPGFFAREVAAESIRQGLYDQLADRGVPGVADLRKDEGSLIKVRNAAEGQVFNGEKTVSSTRNLGTAQKAGRAVARIGGAMVGSSAAGPLGAGAGTVIAGEVADSLIGSEGLNRNQLIARAYKTPTSSFLGYPQGKVQAVPPKSVPRGTQLPLAPQPPQPLTTETNPQLGLFNTEPSQIRGGSNTAENPTRSTDTAANRPVATGGTIIPDAGTPQSATLKSAAEMKLDEFMKSRLPSRSQEQIGLKDVTTKSGIDKIKERLRKPFVKDPEAGVLRMGGKKKVSKTSPHYDERRLDLYEDDEGNNFAGEHSTASELEGNAWLAPTGEIHHVGDEHSEFMDEETDPSIKDMESRRGASITKALNLGHIRVNMSSEGYGNWGDAVNIELRKAPTEAQRTAIATFVKRAKGNVALDLPSTNMHEENTTVGEVMRVIDKEFAPRSKK